MKRKRQIIITIILAVLFTGAGCAYSIYSSYNHLVVNEFELSSEKINSTLKLVLLADLHNHEFGENNAKLVTGVEAQNPDLILLVGDFVNKDSADAEVVSTLVEQLSKVASVYFSFGNHERGYMKARGWNEKMDPKESELAAKLEEAGAIVLDLDWQDIELEGQKLRIGGIYDYAFALDGYDSTNPEKMKPQVYQFLTEYQEVEEDVFTLMLSHKPDSFVLGQASQTWKVDLVLSGHIHGGQVVLPFFGGLYGGDLGWFPVYDHGLFAKDNIHILVTSGLGSSNQFVPRFNNKPEIAVICLKPAE